MSAETLECDVAVVGAGPAGLACASACARAGLETVVIDENATVGGQAYRAITRTPMTEREVLGADYWLGRDLVDEFTASGARHLARAGVWSITPQLELAVSMAGATRIVSARSVVLATGAIERPFPIPGWTLPGVMTLGGAQGLLKSSGLVPRGHAVIAGSGPLVWLAASQILAAGGSIDTILDTTPHKNRARALPHLFGFVFSRYIRRALRMLVAVKGAVPVVPGVRELRAEGSGKLETVSFRTADGGGRTLPADVLLLHQGVVPETHLAMAAGVRHRWDAQQLCWTPVVDANGGTNVPGLLIAGDAAGIGGAQAAAWRGVLAAIAVIEAMEPGRQLPHARLARTALAQFRRGRRFIDALYRPSRHFRVAADDTIVCRCEEVTAGEIRAAIDAGCTGPNQVKAFTRCGMGPCQGRECGLTVTELVAERLRVPHGLAGHFTARFPARPVTVAEIASVPYAQDAVDAVVR